MNVSNTKLRELEKAFRAIPGSGRKDTITASPIEGYSSSTTSLDARVVLFGGTGLFRLLAAQPLPRDDG
jgi:hypothetical protein